MKLPAHLRAVDNDNNLFDSSLKSTSPKAKMLLNLFIIIKCFCKSLFVIWLKGE